MAFNHSPTIVRDGLVLYLDAANQKSYQAGSTTWNNLTDNSVSGSLINGPTFDTDNLGSIVFDGVNDYVNMGTSSISAFGTDDFSIDLWFYSQEDPGSYNIMIGNNSSISATRDNEWALGYIIAANPDQFRFQTFNNILISTTNLPSYNQWHHCVISRNDGSGSMYIDGILEATSSFSTNFNSIRNLYVGGLPNGGWGYFEGNISNVKIYNRALSQQEITQNYNALKGRYNK